MLEDVDRRKTAVARGLPLKPIASHAHFERPLPLDLFPGDFLPFLRKGFRREKVCLYGLGLPLALVGRDRLRLIDTNMLDTEDDQGISCPAARSILRSIVFSLIAPTKVP